MSLESEVLAKLDTIIAKLKELADIEVTKQQRAVLKHHVMRGNLVGYARENGRMKRLPMVDMGRERVVIRKDGHYAQAAILSCTNLSETETNA